MLTTVFLDKKYKILVMFLRRIHILWSEVGYLLKKFLKKYLKILLWTLLWVLP